MVEIDFSKENRLPYIDFVALRRGEIDVGSVEDDLSAYDLTVDDVQLMHDVDLDCHLNRYGINYLIDKREAEFQDEMENRLQNGGLTDDELLARLDNSMYGHGVSSESSYGLDY